LSSWPANGAAARTCADVGLLGPLTLYAQHPSTPSTRPRSSTKRRRRVVACGDRTAHPSTSSTRRTETQVTAPRSAPRRRSGSSPFVRACACRTCARPCLSDQLYFSLIYLHQHPWPASGSSRTAGSPETNDPSRHSGSR
jgi:hypothetical protein